MVTADALHTQRGHAEYLNRRAAFYEFTVKNNQRALHHWGIEKRLHWVRDVTFNEHSPQIRTGNGAHAMATILNPVISVHRLAGATNIARLSAQRRATRKSPINSPADFEKTLPLFERRETLGKHKHALHSLSVSLTLSAKIS